MSIQAARVDEVLAARTGRATAAPSELIGSGIHWDTSCTPNIQSQKDIDHFVQFSVGANSYALYQFFGPGQGKHTGDRSALTTKSDVIARSCHGFMHSVAITHGWISALRYTGQKSVDDITDEASLWYIQKFLLGKYSPWACLLPYLTIVYNRARVPVAYIVDGTEEHKGKIDKLLLQNFNIASRWPREFPGNVKAMYDLWKTGLFKKTEALLLHNILRFNPTTGTFAALPGIAVGGHHHFYHGDNCLRLLERKPNSRMAWEKGRFCSVRDSMSSDNDRYVWGMDGRNYDKLHWLFGKISHSGLGKTIITRFGGKLSIITQEDVLGFLKEFREFYESEIKRVPFSAGGAVIEDPDMDEDDDDIDNYPSEDD